MTRIALSSPLTINVPLAGDPGDGSPGNPYSIQPAIDELFANYDLRGHPVRIKALAGELGSANPYIFYRGFRLSGRMVGQSGLGIPLLNSPSEPPFVIGREGRLSLIGSENPAHPHGAFIYPVPDDACGLTMSEGAALTVRGFGFDTSRIRQDCIDVFDGASLDMGNVVFGNAGANFSNHISAAFAAKVQISGPVMISGSAAAFAVIGNNSCLYWNNNGDPALTLPVTLTGSPHFRDAFLLADAGVIYAHAVGFTGAATGYRWIAMRNGVVATNSIDPNYLPGSAPGFALSGGQYT